MCSLALGMNRASLRVKEDYLLTTTKNEKHYLRLRKTKKKKRTLKLKEKKMQSY